MKHCIEFGQAATEATQLFPEMGCPKKSWKKAVSGFKPSLREKVCPRSAYLGLCEIGLVKGIPKGTYTRRDNINAPRAVSAVHLLHKNPNLARLPARELWICVLKHRGENPLLNYDCQMHVVLALWHADMIAVPQ